MRRVKLVFFFTPKETTDPFTIKWDQVWIEFDPSVKPEIGAERQRSDMIDEVAKQIAAHFVTTRLLAGDEPTGGQP